MNIVYYNATEVMVCDATNEEKAARMFFATRNKDAFARVTSGDFVLVRATAAKVDDENYGAPKVDMSIDLAVT